jgi:hypothetical protein
MNTRSLPLIRTKLHRPPVTGEIVCRKRLHEIMDRALELPLTVVSAPAGYGKSTLVSHWAESLDEPNIVPINMDNIGYGELGVSGDWSIRLQFQVMFPKSPGSVAGIQVGTQEHA